jgi:hypothetical protein
MEERNFSPDMAFGLYCYNTVHRNPFKTFPTVAILLHVAENSLPKLDLLMDALALLCI